MDALTEFIGNVVEFIIQPLIVLIVTAGVAYFIWVTASFIWNSEKADERKKGTQHLLWGIIGIVIMVAVIGILRVVLNSFGINI